MIQFKYQEIEKFYGQFGVYNSFYANKSPRKYRFWRRFTILLALVLSIPVSIFINGLTWLVWAPVLIIWLILLFISLKLNIKAAKELSNNYPSRKFRIWYLVDQYITMEMGLEIESIKCLRDDCIMMSANLKRTVFTWGTLIAFIALIIALTDTYLGNIQENEVKTEIFQILLLFITFTFVLAIGVSKAVKDVANTKSERYHTIAMILGEIKNNKEYLRQKRLFEGRPHNSNGA